MNEEIKAQWLVALRSGSYAQGSGRLVAQQGDYATHCCLGVLCEVAVDAGIIKRAQGRAGYLEDLGDGTPIVQNAILPEKVRSWAGLASRSGSLPEEVAVETESDYLDEFDIDSYIDLAELNDEAGFSFEDIANVIEEQL